MGKKNPFDEYVEIDSEYYLIQKYSKLNLATEITGEIKYPIYL